MQYWRAYRKPVQTVSCLSLLLLRFVYVIRILFMPSGASHKHTYPDKWRNVPYLRNPSFELQRMAGTSCSSEHQQCSPTVRMWRMPRTGLTCSSLGSISFSSFSKAQSRNMDVHILGCKPRLALVCLLCCGNPSILH